MDIEMGLKMQSVVTIFGDIIYDIQNSRLVMENASYILRDKQQLVDLMKKKLVLRRILILFLSVPLIIGGVMFLRRLVESIKQLFRAKQEKVMRLIRERMVELAAEKERNDNQKCSICYTNLKNIILKPCLHLALCHGCLSQLRKKECPFCK